MREKEKSISLRADTTVDDPGQLAQLRGEIYRLLAACFYEPREELAADILHGSMASAFRRLLGHLVAGGWEEGIGKWAEHPDGLDAERMYATLKREYARLFSGPGLLPVPPYESVHRRDVPELERGLVMGRSTVDARQQYAKAGLQISPDFTDLPDHIAVELEFMYFLCAKEAEAWRAEDEDVASRRASAQRVFLADHLAQWVPAFCQAVLGEAQVDFYRGLAQLTQAYIEAECNYMNTGARHLGDGVALTGSAAHAKGGQE